ETFGVTLIEAMACGRPVVATRSGGPQGFITPQTGLLVPRNDEIALAEALQTIHKTYEMYDPHVIRAYAERHFSTAAVAEQLQAIYQEVMTATS
ncbi:MAG: glycosyltransferase, partial [Anaerolineales bacterium]